MQVVYIRAFKVMFAACSTGRYTDHSVVMSRQGARSASHMAGYADYTRRRAAAASWAVARQWDKQRLAILIYVMWHVG